MARETRSLRGEGCIYGSDLGETGEGVDFLEFGETPNLSITVTYDFLERRNTCLKGSPIVERIPINPVTTVSMTIQSFHRENLARVFASESAEVTTSTLTDQEWLAPNGTAFEEDKMYALPNDYMDVGDLVFKDNAGTPVTIASSKYTLHKRFGRIIFNDLAGFTVDKLHISGAVNQPSASAKKIEKVGIATGIFKPFVLRFEGRYTINGIDEYGGLHLYKVQLEPGTEIPLKSPDAFAEATLTGRALGNELLPENEFFGNTGRFIWLNEGAA